MAGELGHLPRNKLKTRTGVMDTMQGEFWAKCFTDLGASEKKTVKIIKRALSQRASEFLQEYFLSDTILFDPTFLHLST